MTVLFVPMLLLLHKDNRCLKAVDVDVDGDVENDLDCSLPLIGLR